MKTRIVPHPEFREESTRKNAFCDAIPTVELDAISGMQMHTIMNNYEAAGKTAMKCYLGRQIRILEIPGAHEHRAEYKGRGRFFMAQI